MKNAMLAAISAVSLGLLTMGCTGGGSGDVVVVQRNEPPLQSTLTVEWSIDESTDPNLCSQSGSVVIEISVEDRNGNEVGAYQQACDAFATSITLDAGDYTAYAVMLGTESQPRTTHVAIAPFTLRGNDELHVPIDFPADSFR